MGMLAGQALNACDPYDREAAFPVFDGDHHARVGADAFALPFGAADGTVALMRVESFDGVREQFYIGTIDGMKFC
ncbi:MAG: hypothetical protein IJ716_08975 [Lachnospiraceae bacterium]|nr:hypothetical protein [Lachnospiraceae bacterium]